MIEAENKEQLRQLQRFYSLQAKFYDITRWAFLFGRRALLVQLTSTIRPQIILEVGCGTGSNLRLLANIFPEAKLIGVDLSAHMLKIAGRKLQPYGERVILKNIPFDKTFKLDQQVDLVLFSYSLSMMNPGWESALQTARNLLSNEGAVAVIDFDDTPLALYRKYMALYHVRMDGKILPYLKTCFHTCYIKQHSVYAGLWDYFTFIGIKVNEGI